MKMMNDCILVALDQESDKIVSGLLFKPDTANEHVFRTAKVVQVGPGKWVGDPAVRAPMAVKPGDGVVFVKFVATHTETAKAIQHVVGKDLAIIHPEDILLAFDHDDHPEFNQ